MLKRVFCFCTTLILFVILSASPVQAEVWNESVLRDSVYPQLRIYIQEDKQEAALNTIEGIIAYYLIKKDSIQLIDVLYKAGKTGQKFRNYPYAIEKYERLLQMPKSLIPQEEFLGSIYRRSFCYLETEDYKKAESGFKTLLEELKKTGTEDPWYETNGYGALASAYRWQAKFQEALSSYQNAIHTDEKYGLEQKGDFLKNMANVYTDLRHFDKSIAILLEALAFYEERGNKENSSYCRVSIASLLIKSGNYDKAFPRLKAEIPIMLKEKNYDRLSLIYCQLGDYYATKKDKAKEYENLDKAYEYAELSQKSYRMAFAKGKLGTFFLNKAEVKKAKVLFEEALAEFSQIEDFDGISHMHLLLGKAQFKLENYAKAKKSINNCLEIAHERGFVNYSKSAYEILSKIEQAGDNKEKALEYQNLFIQFSDSLRSMEKPLKITNAVAQYEQQQNEQTIKEAQSQYSQLIYKRRIELIVLLFLFTTGSVFFLYGLKRRRAEKKKQQELLLESYLELKKAERILVKNKSFQENEKLVDNKGFISIMKLLGEIHATKRKINSYTQANEKSRKDLETKVSLVKTELYTISHDLKVPVEHLKKQVKSLIESSELSKQNKLLKIVSHIESLLQYSLTNIRLNEYKLRPQFFSPNEVLEDLLLLTDMQKLQINSSTMPKVYADPLLIRQVFQNLVDNSIKFTAKEKKPFLNITAKQRNEGIEFLFEDNGIGIEQDAPVFNLFYSSESLKDKFSGVGLYLVKKIIEKHQGNISASDSSYGGIKISFTLPHR